jgi:hypothetical protein
LVSVNNCSVGGYTTLARAADQPPQLLSRSADIRAVQDVERAYNTDGGAHRRRGLGRGSPGCCCLLRMVVEIGVDEPAWQPCGEVWGIGVVQDSGG